MMELKFLSIWLQAVLLVSGVLFNVFGEYIGINIGTDLSNPPSAEETVKILRDLNITHVRLFDADPHLLAALSGTSIEVMVSVTNNELLRICELPSTAAAWVNRHITTYFPSTNITAIAVGSELLTSVPHAGPCVVPAINNLYRALVASNLNSKVRISTPQSMDIIVQPFPPSTAEFNSSFNSTVFQILQFLKSTNSFYMLNAYPYYEYVKGKGIFPLDYALFRPLSPVKQIVDPNTLYHYDSMFDALVDSAYNAISALNFSGIPIVVTETGWPSLGGLNEPDATIENAETYNDNLVRRVKGNNTGPPSQRGFPINAYIYELFNEDRRLGPISERNWGIVSSNGSAVYNLSLGGSVSLDSNASGVYCVVSSGADEGALRNGLNWACGPGQANCRAIQTGQSCYEPNTLVNHASYAYNDYYQRTRGSGGTCDFDGTAALTNVDPSYGSCRFAGSSNSTVGLFPPPALGPVGPPSSGSSRNLVLHIGTVFAVSVILCLVDVSFRSTLVG